RVPGAAHRGVPGPGAECVRSTCEHGGRHIHRAEWLPVGLAEGEFVVGCPLRQQPRGAPRQRSERRPRKVWLSPDLDRTADRQERDGRCNLKNSAPCGSQKGEVCPRERAKRVSAKESGVTGARATRPARKGRGI